MVVTYVIGQARRLTEDVIGLQRGRVMEQAAAKMLRHPRYEMKRRYLAGTLVIKDEIRRDRK